MESGGKAVTKRYRKKITAALSLVLPVIVLFAILNCLRIRILKTTNREGDYWSNMDTGGIKGMHFIRNSGIRLW